MKNLQETLTTARRNLDLIVARRKLLAEKVHFWETMQQEGVGSQPFFYSVVGEDNKQGVKVYRNTQNNGGYSGVWNDIVFRGVITAQNDSPFIWTHIGVCFQSLVDALPTADLDTIELLDSRSTFKGARDFSSLSGGPSPDFRIGFVDKSSGRTLFQAIRKEAGATQKQAGSTPAAMFSLINQAPANTQNASPLHGGLGLWSMPQEVVLPASASVGVDIQSMLVPGSDAAAFFSQTNPRYRVYVTIGGYKVAV